MRHPPSGAHDSAQNAWLGPSSQFSSWLQSPPQSDHPGVACHGQSSTTTCVDLIQIGATPAIWSCSVCTSHGEEWIPVLAKLVWDCRGWVARGDYTFFPKNPGFLRFSENISGILKKFQIFWYIFRIPEIFSDFLKYFQNSWNIFRISQKSIPKVWEISVWLRR